MWAASRIPKGVLWQAQKEGDTLATPAHLSDLIHALLDHAPKLVELITDAQDIWLERAFKVLGLAVPDVASQRRTFFDIYTPTLSYREIRRRGVPSIQPVLPADFLEKHAQTDDVRAKLAANDDEMPFVLNGLLAGLLETTGETGTGLAKELRQRQAEYRADANPYAKWKPWVRLLTNKGLPGPLALTWLCQALWKDVVRPKVERARKNPAAMVRVVASQALGPVSYTHLTLPTSDLV